MSVKMIGLDMDGTLLNSKHEISNNTKEVLYKSMAKGIKVVLASGRLYESMVKPTRDIEQLDEFISLNGAIITSFKENKVIYNFSIPRTDYTFLLDQIKDIDIPTYVFDMDKYYINKDWGSRDTLGNASGINPEIIDDFSLIESPVKILFAYDDESQINEIRKSINHQDYELIHTGFNNVEIMRKKINKGNALNRIAKKYGIKREEIIAIGDSENDMEMISFAGIGVVMGNAKDHVKQIADYITDTCDREGVAKALYQHIEL